MYSDLNPAEARKDVASTRGRINDLFPALWATSHFSSGEMMYARQGFTKPDILSLLVGVSFA
jgi:hypothetical protein